jgi:GNAT superfamily N-acetyltransferase
VCLKPITDRFIQCLETHVDRDQNQLRSGLRFWEHGLRRAYVWRDESGPLCMQWLLTKPDNALLRTLPEWAGMYPPLQDGWGQVENLFAFSTARRKGVATQFEYALYHVARDLGLSGLITHIAEGNQAARGWADRAGWQAYGVIVRYRVDLPVLRTLPLYLHRVGDPI